MAAFRAHLMKWEEPHTCHRLLIRPTLHLDRHGKSGHISAIATRVSNGDHPDSNDVGHPKHYTSNYLSTAHGKLLMENSFQSYCKFWSILILVLVNWSGLSGISRVKDLVLLFLCHKVTNAEDPYFKIFSRNECFSNTPSYQNVPICFIFNSKIFSLPRDQYLLKFWLSVGTKERESA